MSRRCAIYTRKSSDEGLDQAFNSLHAQREACEAYVRSQAGEGWEVLNKLYDDGGFSGGDLNRPGLRKLLADVSAGRVDVIVVYKVDRLSRAIVDFARLVETFDRQGVAFVSVTQPFNSTSSMGRLTLNVLLSFAQFEREVTAERIRDKIAASKAKGMWMGGVVPLGYDRPVDNARALVVNKVEAERVRTLFQRCLQLGKVQAVRDWAEAAGLRSKARVTEDGQPFGSCVFTNGALRHLLSNPIYTGDIGHKGARYPGRHAAIVDRALFDAVQDVMARRSADVRNRRGKAQKRMLWNLVFDGNGDRMDPVINSTRGRGYAYYASSSRPEDLALNSLGTIRRVPAPALEAIVVDWAAKLLGSDRHLIANDEVRRLFERIEIHPKGVDLVVRVAALGHDQRQAADEVRGCLEPAETLTADPRRQDLLRIGTPLRLVTRGGRKWIATADKSAPRTPDSRLVRDLRRGHDVLRKSGVDRDATKQMSKMRAPRDPRDRKLALLSFLAPDLQRRVFCGEITQLQLHDLPLSWAKQRLLVDAQSKSRGDE
jgi:site-specific DNA recombinase